MDYSQLSDFEINKRVAIATGQNIKFIFLDDDDNEIGVLVGRKGCREKKDFDPCNNAADAWPIIESNFIALHPLKHKSVWIAMSDDQEHTFRDEKPLRAAMIVFLMSKESFNA
ncbi:phage protein NinX family protein [Enterobacter cloacae complex sp. 2021EL-01169]|uniref:phage protein NinX family protein n=1 Tax=Enterobacter cloacae complex sp. 2021EL-01169 TaxID=2887193 RepID=UPI001D140B67|nr:phage protein NinX family protein [Enterobacter cloacae complex sp. 2021EL-01169]MCC3240618.1 DUF2591 domain-containing protein [Enterobacter cloacae complex sp. 2021EL-01169]